MNLFELMGIMMYNVHLTKDFWATYQGGTEAFSVMFP